MNIAVDQRKLSIAQLLSEARAQAEEICEFVDQDLRVLAEATGADLGYAQTPKQRGDLFIDPDTRRAEWKGQAVQMLTVLEFDVLEFISRKSEHVRTRNDFLDRFWKETYVCDRSVDSIIKRLRKKIRRVDPSFQQIETVYGLGYKWKAQQA